MRIEQRQKASQCCGKCGAHLDPEQRQQALLTMRIFGVDPEATVCECGLSWSRGNKGGWHAVLDETR